MLKLQVTTKFKKDYKRVKKRGLIRALVDARTSQNLTQKELSEKTGIAQTEISRLENGTRNPSIKLLQRLADGMGMVLNVTFTPKRLHNDVMTSGKRSQSKLKKYKLV